MGASPAELIRNARLRAGFSQAELARRMGTTQSSVARLERAGSNPRVGTLSRALAAANHKVFLAATRDGPEVDETLIAAQLRMTPSERFAASESARRDMDKLLAAAAKSRGDSR